MRPRRIDILIQRSYSSSTGKQEARDKQAHINRTVRKPTMNRTVFALAAALSLAGLSAHAESPDPSGQFAARPGSPTLTRAQVRAELERARLSGDLLAPGERGLTEYESNPSAYPARAALASKSREQVRAETLQAIRDGDILAPGDVGVTLRELYPRQYRARSSL
jgi:hypothetical protein